MTAVGSMENICTWGSYALGSHFEQEDKTKQMGSEPCHSPYSKAPHDFLVLLGWVQGLPMAF